MNDFLEIIKNRHSARAPFDSSKPIPKDKLEQILEAARWTPTAHNMQNFQILVIDDKAVLEKIGNIESCISEVFLRENYAQLSFSSEELEKKKTGILASGFPPAWIDPAKMSQVAREAAPMPLIKSIRGSPAVLIVFYDPAKRAPASEGDVLGFMSLGCLMQNVWLVAAALEISLQILSSFASAPVERNLKEMLNVPPQLKIAFAIRLGYAKKSTKYPRVRRNIDDFVHHNRFGERGI